MTNVRKDVDQGEIFMQKIRKQKWVIIKNKNKVLIDDKNFTLSMELKIEI